MLKRIVFMSGFGKVLAVDGMALLGSMLHRWKLKHKIEVSDGTNHRGCSRVGQWSEGSFYIKKREAQAFDPMGGRRYIQTGVRTSLRA